MKKKIIPDKCGDAISLEWKMKDKLTIYPGMPAEQREKADKGNTSHVRAMDRIWRSAKDLLEREEDVVSGRLYAAKPIPTGEGAGRADPRRPKDQ